MKYLLDTNACIAIINGQPEPVRERFTRAVGAGQTVVTSSIVVFELWYGVGKSKRLDYNVRRLDAFLAGPIEVIAFTDEDALSAGEMRATLEANGTPIGPYDVLIAGQASRMDAVVVTSNQREFNRVQGLVTDDWSRPL